MFEMNPIAAPIKIPHMPSTGRYMKNFSLSMKNIAAKICPTLWKNPPAALTPTTENFFVRLSRIIAAKLKSPPLMLKKIIVGEPANIPAKKIRAVKIISASISDDMYSATTVTTFAKPNFAPGGKKIGGNSPSTVNRINDRLISVAFVVSRRKLITRNFNQQLVRHASNRFAVKDNRAASHANFIGAIGFKNADCPVSDCDNIFSATRLDRENFFRRQVKFTNNHAVNFHDGNFFFRA